MFLLDPLYQQLNLLPPMTILPYFLIEDETVVMGSRFQWRSRIRECDYWMKKITHLHTARSMENQKWVQTMTNNSPTGSSNSFSTIPTIKKYCIDKKFCWHFNIFTNGSDSISWTWQVYSFGLDSTSWTLTKFTNKIK